MTEDKRNSPLPPVTEVLVRKGYLPTQPINEGYRPATKPGKEQAGYQGPTGQLPPPPSGGSSFKPKDK